MVRDIEILEPDDSGAVAKSLSAADYALDVANNLATAEQERIEAEDARKAAEGSIEEQTGRAWAEAERQREELERQEAEAKRWATFEKNEGEAPAFYFGGDMLLLMSQHVTINEKEYYHWKSEDSDEDYYSKVDGTPKAGDALYTYDFVQQVGPTQVGELETESRWKMFNDAQNARTVIFNSSQNAHGDRFLENENARQAAFEANEGEVTRDVYIRGYKADRSGTIVVDGKTYYGWANHHHANIYYSERQAPLNGDIAYTGSSMPTPSVSPSGYYFVLKSRWDMFKDEQEKRMAEFGASESHRITVFAENEGESSRVVYKVGSIILGIMPGTFEINGKPWYKYLDKKGIEYYSQAYTEPSQNNPVYTYAADIMTEVGSLDVVTSRWGIFNAYETQRNQQSSEAAGHAESIYNTVKQAYESGEFKGEKGADGGVLYPSFDIVDGHLIATVPETEADMDVKIENGHLILTI